MKSLARSVKVITVRVKLARPGVPTTLTAPAPQIMLGNVHTHIIRPGNQLPADSLYLPIEEEYQARRLDKFQSQ